MRSYLIPQTVTCQRNRRKVPGPTEQCSLMLLSIIAGHITPSNIYRVTSAGLGHLRSISVFYKPGSSTKACRGQLFLRPCIFLSTKIEPINLQSCVGCIANWWIPASDDWCDLGFCFILKKSFHRLIQNSQRVNSKRGYQGTSNFSHFLSSLFSFR